MRQGKLEEEKENNFERPCCSKSVKRPRLEESQSSALSGSEPVQESALLVSVCILKYAH